MRTYFAAGCVAFALTSFATGAVAQSTPDVPVDWAGETWIRDRYEPDEFEPIGSYKGRSDVVRILIGEDGYTTNRGASFASTFYNTQGRKAVVDLPSGSVFATADLYVPQAWKAQQSTNWQATGLWGETYKPIGPGIETVAGYPIVAFANSEQVYGTAYGSAGALGGRFMVWDGNANDWVILSDPVKYNEWNTIRFEIHSDRYEFYVNGKLVLTDTNIDTDPDVYLKNIFLNSVNNNTDEYEAFYANVLAGIILNSSDYDIVGSVPGMTEFYTFSSLGDLVTRRGIIADQHFSLENYTWMYAGGLTGNFDFSGTSGFDGTAYFVRFGQDVIQPMEEMRIGLTTSAGEAFTNHDQTGGSADSENYSVGAYITYATPQFYADVLAEYGWGNWNIDAPNQSRVTSDTETFAVSAEAGTSIPLSKELILVPNAQIVTINSDIDDLSYSMVSVTYDTETSVIGRVGARLQYEDPMLMSGGRFYVGVSAVKDLAGDTTTALQSVAFAGALPRVISGSFQETAAQFSGGFDLDLDKAVRVFADANYLIGDDTEAFRGSGGLAIKW